MKRLKLGMLVTHRGTVSNTCLFTETTDGQTRYSRDVKNGEVMLVVNACEEYGTNLVGDNLWVKVLASDNIVYRACCEFVREINDDVS